MKKVTSKLRVAHFPQVPCKAFYVDVVDEVEASKIMNVLANQHLFLFNQNIIPDYCNIIIVQMLESEEWVDYWNEVESMEFEQFEETYLTKEN